MYEELRCRESYRVSAKAQIEQQCTSERHNLVVIEHSLSQANAQTFESETHESRAHPAKVVHVFHDVTSSPYRCKFTTAAMGHHQKSCSANTSSQCMHELLGDSCCWNTDTRNETCFSFLQVRCSCAELVDSLSVIMFSLIYIRSRQEEMKDTSCVLRRVGGLNRGVSPPHVEHFWRVLKAKRVTSREFSLDGNEPIASNMSKKLIKTS